MWPILIGAAFVIGGVLLLFRPVLDRRASNPHRTPQGDATLEPPRQGLRFLGLAKSWLALAAIVVGALLLAFGHYL
ncbi:hypothetical protein [Rhizobium grahamii]|uniref:Transmembrane protein n=2 Tax=Rhizobium grahamii TaxID=1120045 RepID=S3HFC8_9HYPH|nr:hypothetical protein [Rhizobium grahamii]EPE96790.1 hypothetical protein RGCCGE502_19220 [Rhizobium grahamii CCGE 502]RDJ04007.1 hypothetical protein B5K06_29360 [Rhizobium grahamii]